MATPTFTCEIAFASDPQDSSPTWTDVSSYLIGGTIKRGRQRLLDRSESGTLSLVLDNSDRRFEPEYASSPYYPDVLPGKLVKVTARYGLETYPLFYGNIERWPVSWGLDNSEVTIEAADVLTWLSRVAVGLASGAWNPAGGDLWGATYHTGQAVNAILSNVGWPGGSVSTGKSLVQAWPGSTGDDPATTMALDLIQRLTDTEAGYLFVDASGTFTFQDRFVRLGSPYDTSQATFADDGTGIPYEDLTPEYDADLIRNDISVTRMGGTTQKAHDATSESDYGPRSFSLDSLLLQTDNETLDRAQWLLRQYKDPHKRITEIQIRPSALATGVTYSGEDPWVVALNSELGRRVTVVKNPPGGGSGVSQQVFIESIQHEFTDTDWLTTYSFSPTDFTGYLVLDSATNGKLDYGALAY